MSPSRSTVRHRALRLVAAVAVMVGVSALPTGGSTPAGAGVQVNGAGSTWSEVAVQQWAADVARQGISINFQGNGASAGRAFYYNSQVDFANSDIPFQANYCDITGTGCTNEVALAQHRPWVYLPIIGGGTSFMYHLKVNGTLFRDLRLSAQSVTKIFTGTVTRWNDPAIAADNPGVALPATPIRPVIRSDGSATSFQFSMYMAHQAPDVWNAFCRRVGVVTSPCPPTSLYPEFTNSVGQQLSDGVANYVAAPYSDGTITYVEYAYALKRNYPVASVLNAAGYYTQPTAQAVAIALQGARINPDRTQVLDGVYQFADPRTYPVSSYGYMIAPTTTARPFSTEKGDVLGRFILYLLCTGQQKAAQLGYSPLPKNLVQIAFEAESHIPGAPAPPPIDQCANPTITGDFITGQAPMPPASAKLGASPAAAGGASAGEAAVDPGASTELAATGLEAEGVTERSGQLVAATDVVSLGRGGSSGTFPAYAIAVALVLAVAFAPPAFYVFGQRRAARRTPD